MNNSADKNLLNHVLAETTPADFRAALLSRTLGLVRRRRRWRQLRQAAALLAALGICGILVWQKNLPRRPFVPTPETKAGGPGYKLVQTHALPASAVVTTQPLVFGQLIAPKEAVAIVQTSSGNYRIINDDQLLALIGPRPAVLIRTGPHTEELVFANAEDQKVFR
jgi:hypothetical protein